MNMETKDKLIRICKERGISRKKIIAATGANKSTVSTWFNGISKPSGLFLYSLAKVLNVDASWLIDDKLDFLSIGPTNDPPDTYLTSIETWDDSTPLRDDEVALPFFTEVEAAAGAGNPHVQENHGPKLRFAKNTLDRYNIQPENAACIRVKGNSMEPVLPNGSTVGVDTGSTMIVDGKMFAIDHDGMLRVKMLYQLPGGGIRLRSYNATEHPDESYNAEDYKKHIRIIGRVFWSSVLY